MDDFNQATSIETEDKQDKNLKDSEHYENEKPLIDMDNFERLDEDQDDFADSETHGENNEIINSSNNTQSGLVSTTRPLMTTLDDETVNDNKIFNSSILGTNESQEKLHSENISSSNSPVKDSSTPVSEQRHAGDILLIGDENLKSDNSEVHSSTPAADTSSVSVDKIHGSKVEDVKPQSKDPKIDTNPVTGSSSPYDSGNPAYETIAQAAAKAKSEFAMEADTSANAVKADGDCPFSPGSWFNPEKLHPTVAEYVYWRDVKKSGIAFGSSLVLLLSLRFFSLISVVAYVILAVLSVTVSFRIYKTVLQAVQKSNEGHPFKEYLDVDLTLSQDKLKDTAEVLIHHVNCVTTKLRSLILVEDLFDTIKLGLFAWILTYIGAWFNGLTLIILALVAAFTVPKVYETNKTQIDLYAELLRTKGKELKEMINAKMPLGKKKKEQ